MALGHAKTRVRFGMDSQTAAAKRRSPERAGAKRRTAKPLTGAERKLPLEQQR